MAPATGASVTVTAPSTAGTLTATLEVRDSIGAAVATRPTRSVTVTAANQAPNGTITPPASITQGVAATFQGSGTDPDGDAVTYAWSFGANATPATSTVQNPSVTFSTTGTRTVTLTVTDARGLADASPASVQVTVAAPANQAPNGTITAPASVVQGVAATFQGSATDLNGNAVTYAWNFGANATPATSTAQNPSVTFSTTGSRTVTLTVTDSLGLADPTPASVSVNVTAPPVTNEPPNGTITPPASITQGQAVTFQGSATDANGDAVTYAWTFGANATPATSNVQNPSVTFSTAGSRAVTLTVTDSRGLADPTPASVTVNVTAPPPANAAPNGTITPPANITQGVAATFQGSATDSDGDAVTYAWNFGANATPATSTAQNPSVTFSTTGSRTVTLTVTDARGLADPTPASVSANVVAPAPPPVVRCTDADNDGYSPTGGSCGPVDCNDANSAVNPGVPGACSTPAIPGIGSPLGCLGTLTAPPVIITQASWGPDDGVNQLKVDGSQASPGAAVTVFNAASGALLGTTTVDSTGSEIGQWEFEMNTNTPPCSVRVEINGATAQRAVSNAPATCIGSTNRAPTATITAPSGNVTIAQGQTVDFAGSGSDPDGNPLTYSWTFAGGTPTTATVADPPAVSFGVAGTYTVSFTVRDSAGATASATRTVTVTAQANRPPTASISAPTGNVTVTIGQSVDFAGSGTDPDGNALSYNWAFNGGTPTSAAVADPSPVNFNTAGTHTVTFTVRDSAGATASATRTVTVNRPPVATITAPTGNVTITQGGTVDFAGTGSDPDGNALSYNWAFNGGTPTSATVADPAPVTFNTVGTFTATLTVRDSAGATASASRTVTVNAAPVLPISRAEWDDRVLQVRGSGAASRTTVILRNASTNTEVARTTSTSIGTWRFDVRGLTAPPCTVRVAAGNRIGVRAVSDAPSGCLR